MNFVLLIKAKDECHLASKMEKLYISGSGSCSEKYIKLTDVTNNEIKNFKKYQKRDGKDSFYDYVKEYDNKVFLEKDFLSVPPNKLKSFYKIVIIDNKESKNVIKVIKPENPRGIVDGYKKTSMGEGFFKMKDGRVLASNLKIIDDMPYYDRHIENINKLNYNDPDWNDLFFNKAFFMHKETEDYYIKEASRDYDKFRKIADDLKFETLETILKRYKVSYKRWIKSNFSNRKNDKNLNKAWKEYCSQSFIKILKEAYSNNNINYFIYINPEVLFLWDKEKYINYKKMSTIGCYKFFDNKKVHSKNEKKIISEYQRVELCYKWAEKVYNFINKETNENLYILDCHR